VTECAGLGVGGGSFCLAVGDVVELVRLPGDRRPIVEATVPERSPVVGRSLAEIDGPRGCVAVAVIRASEAPPAGQETRLRAGDRLACLADTAQVGAPNHLVTGSAQPG